MLHVLTVSCQWAHGLAQQGSRWWRWYGRYTIIIGTCSMHGGRWHLPLHRHWDAHVFFVEHGCLKVSPAKIMRDASPQTGLLSARPQVNARKLVGLELPPSDEVLIPTVIFVCIFLSSNPPSQMAIFWVAQPPRRPTSCSPSWPSDFEVYSTYDSHGGSLVSIPTLWACLGANRCAYQGESGPYLSSIFSPYYFVDRIIAV